MTPENFISGLGRLINKVTLIWLIGFMLSIPMTLSADELNSNEQKYYKFGVFPMYSPSRLEEVFSPIALELDKAIQHPVRLSSTHTFDKFMQELSQAKYDIAYIQPFDYVRIAESMGYVPLVSRNEPLTAVLMVRVEQTEQSVLDLRNKLIALPPEVAAVSYLTKLMLIRAGLVPGRDVHLRHFKSHDSCLHQLIIHSVDACATARPPVRHFEAKMQVKLRQIAESDAIPHTLFVVHQRVPDDIRSRIINSLMNMKFSPLGQKVFLQSIDHQAFKLVDSEDYEPVRRYWKMIKSFDGL